MNLGSLNPFTSVLGGIGAAASGSLAVLPDAGPLIAAPAVLGLLVVYSVLLVTGGGTAFGTASAVANNPFLQHDLAVGSAEGSNAGLDAAALVAEHINNLNIPGLHIPVQRM